MKLRRVVVTGMGIVSPLGNEVELAWRNALAGKSGVDTITSFDISQYPSKIAGLVKGFDPTNFGLTSKDARKMDPFVQYGFAAAYQAVLDAGFNKDPDNAQRFGVVIGSGIGGLEFIEKNHAALTASGPRKVSPFFIPGAIINIISGYVSMHFGFKGPNLSVATACTTGCHSIGLAARTIAYSDADVMVAGGAEKASTPLGVGGFSACRALSTRNDEPTRASRPWDKDRDGFVLGDGAGVLVLESYEHAKARGARIYAELVGFGMSGSAYHVTQYSEGGIGEAQSMINAIQDAQINPEQIDYINAHGTSTPLGDVGEVQAIRHALKGHASQVAISSTKSMTGHLLGAAGAVEAIFTIKSVQEQMVAPTINLDSPSEDCDLDFVPNKAREMKIEYAMSNSFGFGGTNGALIFKQIS